MSTGSRSVLRTGDGGVRWWVTLILVFAVAIAVTSCYGEFPLTKIVYRLNGSATDFKLIQTIVMWVFLIVPVYTTAIFVDAVVLNLVEFWTGAKIDVSRGTARDGTELVLAPSADGREAVLTASRDGKVVGRATFVRVSETEVEVRDGAGSLAGRVLRRSDGGFRLTDGRGATVATVPAAELAAAHRK